MLKGLTTKLAERLGLAQATLRAPATPLDELVKAREDAEGAAAQATEEIARLAAARPALLISAGDDELAAHDAAAAMAARTLERANALLPLLAEKIAAAEHEKDQQRRRKVVADAMVIISAAAERAGREIPEILRLFLGVHEAVREARFNFLNALEDKPEGDVALHWPVTLREAQATLANIPRYAIPPTAAQIAEAKKFAELKAMSAPSMPYTAVANMIQTGLKHQGAGEEAFQTFATPPRPGDPEGLFEPRVCRRL